MLGLYLVFVIIITILFYFGLVLFGDNPLYQMTILRIKIVKIFVWMTYIQIVFFVIVTMILKITENEKTEYYGIEKDMFLVRLEEQMKEEEIKLKDTNIKLKLIEENVVYEEDYRTIYIANYKNESDKKIYIKDVILEAYEGNKRIYKYGREVKIVQPIVEKNESTYLMVDMPKGLEKEKVSYRMKLKLKEVDIAFKKIPVEKMQMIIYDDEDKTKVMTESSINASNINVDTNTRIVTVLFDEKKKPIYIYDVYQMVKKNEKEDYFNLNYIDEFFTNKMKYHETTAIGTEIEKIQ